MLALLTSIPTHGVPSRRRSPAGGIFVLLVYAVVEYRLKMSAALTMLFADISLVLPAQEAGHKEAAAYNAAIAVIYGGNLLLMPPLFRLILIQSFYLFTAQRLNDIIVVDNSLELFLFRLEGKALFIFGCFLSVMRSGSSWLVREPLADCFHD